MQMYTYMYQGSYTAQAVADQIAEPRDRTEDLKHDFADMGAKIVRFGYTFGEHDVVVVYEAPNDSTAAAVALAIAADGSVRSAKTTRLMNGAEWIESLEKAGARYKRPDNT